MGDAETSRAQAPEPEVYGGWQDRPEPDYELSSGWRTLRWASVVVGAVPMLLIGWRALEEPGQVPVHFAMDGSVTRMGSPWELFLAPVLIWLLCVLGMTLLSRHPRIFNFPKPLTSENVQDMYRLGERMLIALAASAAVLCWGMVGAMPGMPLFWLTWVGGAGVVGVAAVGIWQMVKA